MNDSDIDPSQFPPRLHRIVRSWYSWQEVHLRKVGRHPGADHRKPLDQVNSEEISWDARPPAMTNEYELRFLDNGAISDYLVIENNRYFIDGESRGWRGRYAMFKRFEDAEKYILFLISQAARRGDTDESPGFRWHQGGLNPRVTLTKLDPAEHPERVSLIVDQESTDRGWMSEHNAIAASHIVVRSFTELDAALREGIPPAWFSTRTSDGVSGQR